MVLFMIYNITHYIIAPEKAISHIRCSRSQYPGGCTTRDHRRADTTTTTPRETIAAPSPPNNMHRCVVAWYHDGGRVYRQRNSTRVGTYPLVVNGPPPIQIIMENNDEDLQKLSKTTILLFIPNICPARGNFWSSWFLKFPNKYFFKSYTYIFSSLC